MANEKRMGAKFTSGPWKFAGTFATTGNEFVDTAAVECGDGMIVANLNYDKENATEKAKAIADARLIAQAPAMYALLSRMTSFEADALTPTMRAQLTEARAILAAVEGK